MESFSMYLCDLDLHPCGGHLSSTDWNLFGKTRARVLLVWTGPPGSKWWLPRYSWVTLRWLNWGVLMLTVILICSHSYWVWAMVWNMTALPGAERTGIIGAKKDFFSLTAWTCQHQIPHQYKTSAHWFYRLWYIFQTNPCNPFSFSQLFTELCYCGCKQHNV